MKQYKLPTAFAVTVLAVSGLGSSFAFADTAAPGPVGAIAQLNNNIVVSSTVDATNGDQNPYAVVVDTRPGSATLGQVFVSNFSDKNGVNGAGSTVEEIVNGKPVTYATGATGPAAMAFSPKGPLWIANFGQMGTDGNVQVTKPNGASFGANGIVTNSAVVGPWGQAFAGPYTAADGSTVPPAFFVTGANNGTVAAMYNFTPPTFNTTTQFTVIGSGLAHNGTTANNIQGPQGMAWNGKTHILYVTDTADNSIRSFTWTGASTQNQGQGQLVYQGGALQSPVGLAIDPLNGDLLVVNQGNNDLVEIAPGSAGNGAHVVGQVVLDNTPVNPTTGAGAALFGLAATTDANGNLVVYYSNDNTNTLDELRYQPNYSQVQVQTNESVTAGGQSVANPAYLQATDPTTGNSQKFVSVYFLEQALQQLGYSSTWDDGALTINPAASATLSLPTVAPQSLANGLASVTVNGQVIAYVQDIVANDPATHRPTTYASFSDLQAMLHSIGIALTDTGSSFDVSVASK